MTELQKIRITLGGIREYPDRKLRAVGFRGLQTCFLLFTISHHDLSSKHPCVFSVSKSMVLKIVIAGMVGALVMTAVMYVIAFVTKDRFKVVKILGTMLTFQTTPDKGLSDNRSAIFVGLAAHYLVGVSFSFAYFGLWSADILSEDFMTTTWLGFANGIVGAIGWKILIAIHPDPPDLPLSKYLVAIAIGHIFFAYGILGTALVLS